MRSIFKHDNLFALCWCFFFLVNLPVRGQDVQLPTIIPPSPTAQNFMRYGEIPVDYSTGIPNIQIPLYTVKGRKLELPISISYHASGIKVRDVASEVGLGWVLNAGGVISRTVNGKHDESLYSHTFENSQELYDSLYDVAWTYEPSSTSLIGIMNFEHFFNGDFVDIEDPMSDRYFYRLPNGTSGVFTYDYNVTNGESLVTLPYRPYEIERIKDGTPSHTNFKITDDNGTVYRFQLHLYQSNPYSEWFLEEMISAGGEDTIRFEYIEQTAAFVAVTESFVYQRPTEINVNCPPNNPQSSMHVSFGGSANFSSPILDRIVSSEAVVKFHYANREDFDGLNRLTEITVAAKSTPNIVIKKIQFMPKYFGETPASKRLGLDHLVITSPGDSEEEKYTFTYEGQVLPPYPRKMSTPRYSEDFWGYYNGANSTSMVPINFISNPSDKSLYGGNRKPDPTGFYSKACMLKEIKYPTGGKTVFVFERNYANGVFPEESYPKDRNDYVGGFRIGSVSNFDENNKLVGVKSYEYRRPAIRPVTKGHFYYFQDVAERADDSSKDEPFSWCWANYTNEVVVSNPILPLEVAPGLPVMYREVVEYNGTKSDNIGRTIYKYGEPYSPSDYNHPDHPMEFEASWYYHPYHYDKGNYVPEMISKKVYSFDGVKYRPVLEESYGYAKHYTEPFNTGIKLSRRKVYKDHTYFVVPCGTNPVTNNCIPLIWEYIESIVAIDTKAYQEASLLTKTTRYDFDPLDSTQYVLTSTDYIYNETNLAVSEKLTVSSEDDVLKTTYAYPHDLMPEEPYRTMFAKGIISPVIEESRYNVSQSDKLISKVRTRYKNWGNNIIEPENVQVKKGADGFFEDRVEYLSYDGFGNVASVRKKDDSPVTYLWGYNGLYPVAEVVGADHATVSGLVNLQMLKDAGSYPDHQVRTELDKIRDGLAALGRPFSVVTYTYRPAVGVTSQTDTNGATTFYEYDNAGRLVSIKDQHGDIVKTYDYHYRK